MADGSIKIDTKIDQAGVKSGLKEMDKSFSSFVQKSKNIFAGMRDVMQGPIAAFNMVKNAVGNAIRVLGDMEKEAIEASRSFAVLESTVRATGAGSWTTAKAIKEMADNMEELTGYSAESIQDMQTVLLGFKNIKGDSFDEATKSIIDMATVMKMDLSSAAQAVGKALDDPINGIDSLSRQGFKFSDSQKEVLKELVNTGRQAEAQKIILDELNTTYGGAAEAAMKASGGTIQFAKAVGDLREEIGRQVSQTIGPLRSWFAEVIQGYADAQKAYNDFQAAIKAKKSGTETTDSEITRIRGQISAQEEYINQLSASGQMNTANEDKKLEALRNELKLIESKKKYEDEMASWRAEAQNAVDESLKKEAERKAGLAKIEADKLGAEKALIDARKAAQAEYEKAIDISNAKANAGLITQEENTDNVKSAAQRYMDTLLSLGYRFGDMTTLGGQALEQLRGDLKLTTEETATLTSDVSGRITTAMIIALAEIDRQARMTKAAGIDAAKTFLVNFAKGMKANLSKATIAAKNAVGNIAKAVKTGFKLFSSLIRFNPQDALDDLQDFLDDIEKFFTTTLPSMPIYFKAGIDMIAEFLRGMRQDIGQTVTIIENVIGEISRLIISSAPQIIADGFFILLKLMEGLAGSSDTISKTIVDVIGFLAGALIANADDIIKLGLAIVAGIIVGVFQAMPSLAQSILDGFIDLFTEADLVSGILIVLAAAIAGYALAVNAAAIGTGLLSTATTIATAAQAVWNAVMNANPIGLVVAGIAALIAIILLLIANWDDVLAAVGRFANGAASVLGWLYDGVARLFSGLVDIIKAPFNFAIMGINAIIRGLNTLSIKIPKWVPVVGGNSFGFDIPEIPMLAKGTDNAKKGFAIVGENGPELVQMGGGERVYPAGETSSIMSSIMGGLQSFMGGGSLGGSNGLTIHNMITAPVVIDGRQTARAVYENWDKVAK